VGKKTCVSVLAVLTWLGVSSGAQLAVEVIEPRKIVDCPTAGLLPRASFDLDLRIFAEGGLLAGLEVGLMDRLLVGFSFGGQHIVGSGDINWHPRVEFAAKYRVFEEGRRIPALAIGFDSQGFGAYADSLGRYAIKSRGVYFASSKNYSLLGGLGVHGGVYYSFERDDGDEDPSAYVGIDKVLNAEVSVCAEYDFAVNDNDNNSLGSGNGYLNAGIRWTFAHKLDIEFDVKNLTRRSNVFLSDRKPSREVRVVYLEYF